MLRGAWRNDKQDEAGGTLVPSSNNFPSKPFSGLYYHSLEFGAFSAEV